MEEGEDGEHSLPALLRPEEPGPRLEGIGNEISVREHRPLGGSRGSAGVLEDGHVLCWIELGTGRPLAAVAAE